MNIRNNPLKHGILILLAIMWHPAIAQKISSEIDQFTKLQRIETGYVLLNGTLVKSIQASFRSNGQKIFFRINGLGQHLIGTDDKLQFLFIDESVITIFPTSVQSYDLSGSLPSWRHEYFLTNDDLELLKLKEIKAIRKYTADGYIDYPVTKEKYAQKLKKLAYDFAKEL